ncbi:thioesterase II family protein [Streptomyces sp. SP18CS02]|uniref:thioesterase II family protein n=1 Tax=Streptomyces sp. SP18CS02 TaxID=3002531 RepID=UPI002E792EB1|nr:alpha/beta fold hydrolase [Streptomyces sp. SP18CS02]MEE1754632.1 alpha/beta fold hydrolase [Streptomyces sp. SP18CS02]
MSSGWIRRFHPAPEAGTRLVCFPHAGGSATFYFPVSRAVSPGVDVLAVQYPGRQDRLNEPCVDDIPTLADRITEELVGWADRPLTLFGHSMGATIAFEVARRLEARGIVPLGLFASGRRAPSSHRDERVHLRDDDGLVRELQRLSGTDAEVLADEAILRMVLPAMRSDYRAVETYRYTAGPPLNCPVTALTADDDPLVDVAEAEAWAQHTVAPFRIRVFTGGHFFVTAHAESVMREITGHIEAATTPR